MSFYHKPVLKHNLYHFSKDKRIRGHVITTDLSPTAYIYDNKTGRTLLYQRFKRKEIREANTWLFEHLDCPLFTMLQSIPKQA